VTATAKNIPRTTINWPQQWQQWQQNKAKHVVSTTIAAATCNNHKQCWQKQQWCLAHHFWESTSDIIWLEHLIPISFSLTQQWPTYHKNWLFAKVLVWRIKCNAGKNTWKFQCWEIENSITFEANFNANNKWLGWAVMLNAETLDLLADKQYGSHRNKVAVLQCLNEVLFYDLVWFWKRPAALCSNDAKSCYNCITLLAVALCLCWLGAPILVVQSMVKTISWDEPPHQNGIWRFPAIGQPQYMGNIDCRDWTG